MNVLKPIMLDETGKEIVEALKQLRLPTAGNGEEDGALPGDTVIPNADSFVQKSTVLLLLDVLKSAVYTEDKSLEIANIEKLLKAKPTDGGDSDGTTSGDNTDTGENPDTDKTEPTVKSGESEWFNGVPYDLDTNAVKNSYVSAGENSMSFLPYDGWERTAFLKCDGASRLDFNKVVTTYAAFYTADKEFLEKLDSRVGADNEFKAVAVPQNAAYFVISYPSDFVISPTNWRRQDGTVTPYA